SMVQLPATRKTSWTWCTTGAVWRGSSRTGSSPRSTAERARKTATVVGKPSGRKPFFFTRNVLNQNVFDFNVAPLSQRSESHATGVRGGTIPGNFEKPAFRATRGRLWTRTLVNADALGSDALR